MYVYIYIQLCCSALALRNFLGSSTYIGFALPDFEDYLDIPSFIKSAPLPPDFETLLRHCVSIKLHIIDSIEDLANGRCI